MVALTDKGRDLRDRAENVMACISDAVGMTPSEVSLLMQRLRGLRDNLEAAAA